MRSTDLADRLRGIVGDQYVLTDDQSLDDYGRDAVRWSRLPPSSTGAQRPLAVVRPETTAQVRDIVLLCNETRTAVVPYGAGTGLMGAAVSTRQGIVLDMMRMSRILRVSREDRTVTVQPGIALGRVDRALAEHGLLLAHDPWSQPVASVGGAISTNGVGYLAAGYGAMGDQVVGLEAVTPTGEVLRSKALPKQSTGPDFKHLFIGGEGVFGVITEVTLRAHVLPEERRLYGIRFPSFPAGFHAVEEMSAIGLRPAMVDLAEEGAPSVPSKGETITDLRVLLDGFKESVDAQEKRMLAICAAFGGKEDADVGAETYWERRHAAAERYLAARAAGTWHPWSRDPNPTGYTMFLQPALPPSRVLEYRSAAISILEDAHMQVRECGVWGTPEMFSLLVSDPSARTDEDLARARGAADAALRLAQDMGGNMEHVHGVGLRLFHLMERELGTDTLAVARRLKSALDPNNIMNPGKLYG